MKFARKVAAFAVTAVALSTVFIGVGAASAAAKDCKTVHASLTNHPDSGTHGTWALDAFGREVVVCQLDTASLTSPQKDEIEGFAKTQSLEVIQLSLYSVEVTDGGTFITKGGAHLSPQNGDALTAGVHGNLEGYYQTFVISRADWASWNGDAVEGQIYNPGDSTGEWLKMLFGVHAKWSDPIAWKWIYTTCTEQWVNAASGNHGDITGKLTCPSPSVSPSASPSAVPTSAPASTTSAPVAAPAGNDDGDLPVTGASLFGTISTGVGLVLAGIVVLVVIARRRRAAGN